jgi:hypothetical protein
VSSLDQLAPLIAPPAVGWWPPAPGWWIAATLLPVLCWGMWKLGQWLLRRQARNPVRSDGQTTDPLRLAALAALASLAKPYDGQHAGPWLQQLNALLKRLARAHYPDEHSHTLSGRAWLAFLDSRCPAAGLTRWMVLVEGTYRAECRMSDEAIDGLAQAVNIWIRKHV